MGKSRTGAQSIVRNPTGGEAWLSKLSRFISARAFKIFSKRRTEAKQEPEDVQQEAVPVLADCNGEPEQDIARNGNATNSSEGNGISDLEQMIKQKTFTRSEIDRLTELLHSRKVEYPFRDEEKKNEGNLFQPVSDLKKHVVIRSPLQENRGDSTKSQRNMSATGVSSRVSTNVVANINNADSNASKFSTQPPQVRPAFRMSADEDFPELDDGTSSGEARKELQTSCSSVPSHIIAVEKASTNTEFKTPENLTAISNDVKDYGAPVVAKENTGIQSPALVPVVSNFQQDIPFQSASVVNNSVPSRDSNPSSSLSPENISTVPSFTFSSAPPCTESPAPNHISRPDLKRRGFGSDPQQKAPEVNKADVSDKAGSASQPSDNSTSAAAPASTSGFVSSIVSAENSVLNNGLVASSPFSFSSSAPTLASNNSVEKIFGNSSPSVHSSNSATTVKQSLPFQFGFSGSSTIFGTSGVTSFSLNISVTDLSGPPPKLFGSGTTFAIGATSSPPMMLGQSTGTSSGSLFSFASATAATSSLPSLSQSQPVQSSAPLQLPSPSPSPFYFGGQPNQPTPPNLSPFQASCSQDFNSGGSFLLGSGGGYKRLKALGGRFVSAESETGRSK